MSELKTYNVSLSHSLCFSENEKMFGHCLQKIDFVSCVEQCEIQNSFDVFITASCNSFNIFQEIYHFADL
jgi:hypothetical protein